MPLILASSSKSRAQLLANANIPFIVHAAHVDEQAIKRDCMQQGFDVAATALKLAAAKSARVAMAFPDVLVIGADQMLQCAGRLFDKPTSRIEAEAHLRFLRGRQQTLYSAVAVYKNEALLWNVVVTAQLTMRDFSDAFMQSYLDELGDDALTMVGCCAVEGYGIQLLQEINGEHSAILGLPLLPLLAFLRDEGYIKA